MDDWGNHNQSDLPDSFRHHHHDDKSPAMEDEGDWMDEDSKAELADKEAWLEGDAQARAAEKAEFGLGGEDDVLMQLAQKEQDLMLAAELGKALLEKNQELEEQIGRLTEDFSQKLEGLEQERHSLQSQLTQRQAEYENTIRDLQDDVSNLQEQLRHHDSQTSAGERKHVQDLRKLQQQNEQLSEQLRQSLAQQQALSAEAGQLREQLTSRRSTFHQRVDHVDKLEEEVLYLRQRHQDLEAQIRQVKEERDALVAELDGLQERLLLLEKQRRLQDEQLHQQNTELQELRDTNSLLQSQLERMTSAAAAAAAHSHHQNHMSGDSPTLFSELSHLNDLNISPPASFLQFHRGDVVNCLSAEMIEEDDFEYDDDIFCDVNKHSSPIPSNLGYHGNSLQEEMMRCSDEQLGMDTTSREEEEEEEEDGGASGGGETYLRPSLSRCAISLPSQLHHFHKEGSSDSDETEAGGTGRDDASACAGTDHEVTEMTCDPSDQYDKVKEEEEEEEEEAESTFSRQSQHHHFNEMLQAQQSRIDKLERRVQELECRVQELQQERDKLQDVVCGHVTIDHVLQQTRSERDSAMTRISDMEGELSRLTREVVTLNAQLMDTVRRKVLVSQELDQWQIDLSEVLAVQMQRRKREQHRMDKPLGKLQKGVQSDPTPSKKQNR
ncbi:uncharacterized protein LOC143288491 isoform X2 [Babylonia areolata]|uniref:uncharacterized protein LOC143288491 isoform X2 n=1 Tax=Babylonia areolata TaxID=304850 RepID=UPI003FD56DE3